MYRRIESAGLALLERFVPKISASAQVSPKSCWDQCWQCNSAYGGPCDRNAPCCYDNYTDSYQCYC